MGIPEKSVDVVFLRTLGRKTYSSWTEIPKGGLIRRLSDVGLRREIYHSEFFPNRLTENELDAVLGIVEGGGFFISDYVDRNEGRVYTINNFTSTVSHSSIPVMRFSEKQLPDGYDSSRLKEVLLADRNLELLDKYQRK